MNIFKKALLIALSAGLLSVPSTLDKVETVEAASDTWHLVGAGSFTTNSWSTGDETNVFSLDGSYYTLTVNFKANDQFKILKKFNAWDPQVSYDDNFEDVADGKASIKKYFSNSGGNFKVNEDGNYTLKLKKDVDGWSSGFAWGLRVVKNEVTQYNVTYHADTIETEKYNKDASFLPKFIEKEGYRLEGWYTDSSLTTEFVKGSTVTSDLDLYPKYVEASDYSVYFDASGLFSKVNAYMWSDAFGHNNASWPGTALTKDENGYYKLDVDASKSFDKIIFNDGTNQTENLTLEFEESYYTLSKSGTNYTATYVTVSELTATANLKVYSQVNGTSLRIISTLGVGEAFDLENYENVGFKFTYEGKEKTVTAGFVYTSVVADGQPISAESYGAHYFYVATFNNVPANVTLSVTPFATLTNGVVVYGATASVTNA